MKHPYLIRGQKECEWDLNYAVSKLVKDSWEVEEIFLKFLHFTVFGDMRLKGYMQNVGCLWGWLVIWRWFRERERERIKQKKNLIMHKTKNSYLEIVFIVWIGGCNDQRGSWTSLPCVCIRFLIMHQISLGLRN